MCYAQLIKKKKLELLVAHTQVQLSMQFQFV